MTVEPLQSSGPSPDPEDAIMVVHENPPRWLVGAEVSYLAGLLVVGLLRADYPALRSAFPDPVGPIPLGVIFFGAIGGTTIGLFGIFFHEGKWDHSYDLWHATRPLIGAVLGMVSYLIMVVVLGAAGSTPGSRSNLPYSLVAFLVAYSEGQFRRLVRQATVKLLPGQNEHPKGPAVMGTDPR
jgi:hypothetical protein